MLHSAEDLSTQRKCGHRHQLWKGYNLRESEILS